MEKPLTIAARGVALTPGTEAEIRRRALGLERFYPDLVGCSIVISGPSARHRTGGPYEVLLDLRVPGSPPIHVNRQHQERLARAVDDAFDTATRRLQDLERLQRGQVKRRAEPQRRATVARLFPSEDYGFLETEDGREIYFHRHSILDDFDRLTLGTAVRFHEEAGERGPQASTVVVVE